MCQIERKSHFSQTHWNKIPLITTNGSVDSFPSLNWQRFFYLPTLGLRCKVGVFLAFCLITDWKRERLPPPKKGKEYIEASLSGLRGLPSWPHTLGPHRAIPVSGSSSKLNWKVTACRQQSGSRRKNSIYFVCCFSSVSLLMWCRDHVFIWVNCTFNLNVR